MVFIQDYDKVKTKSIQHNVKIKDKFGIEHQIDILWNYVYAGKDFVKNFVYKNAFLEYEDSIIKIDGIKFNYDVVVSKEEIYINGEDAIGAIVKDVASGQVRTIKTMDLMDY